MKICKHCGNKMIDNVCRCKHTKKEKKKAPKWVLAILIVMLSCFFLWLSIFIYNTQFRKYPCKDFVGVQHPERCQGYEEIYGSKKGE